ncbi:MAG: hypothetical protein ABJB40_12750, partial [Acidobacteriota bacterium]
MFKVSVLCAAFYAASLAVSAQAVTQPAATPTPGAPPVLKGGTPETYQPPVVRGGAGPLTPAPASVVPTPTPAAKPKPTPDDE